jgi:hypothetical protein
LNDDQAIDDHAVRRKKMAEDLLTRNAAVKQDSFGAALESMSDANTIADPAARNQKYWDALASLDDVVKRANYAFRIAPWKRFFCESGISTSLCVPDSVLDQIQKITAPTLTTPDVSDVKAALNQLRVGDALSKCTKHMCF